MYMLIFRSSEIEKYCKNSKPHQEETRLKKLVYCTTEYFEAEKKIEASHMLI